MTDDNDSAPRKKATAQTSPGAVIMDRAGWTLRVLAVVGSFLRVERTVRWFFKGEQLLQETIERLVTPSDCWVISDPVVEQAREAEKAKRAEGKAEKDARHQKNREARRLANQLESNRQHGGTGQAKKDKEGKNKKGKGKKHDR